MQNLPRRGEPPARADERIQAALGVATGATTRFDASHDVAVEAKRLSMRKETREK